MIILLIACALLYGAVSVIVKPGPSANMIVGAALGLSWGLACYRYRSRAEAGWIEGLGRAFGIGLVVTVAANYS